MATRHSHVKTNMEECLKCGIKLEPATFLLLYRRDDKVRKKSMPLRHFTTKSNCSFFASELVQRHKLNISQIKVEKMLRILQEMLKGLDKAAAKEAVETEMKNKSLNKLTTRELELQKQEMDVLFTQNQIKPEDAGYVYDKRVDFPVQKGPSDWDDDVNNDGADSADEDRDDEDFWKNMP